MGETFSRNAYFLNLLIANPTMKSAPITFPDDPAPLSPEQWATLSDDEKSEHIQAFRHAAPFTDLFGGIDVIQNGRNYTAISSSEGNDLLGFWDALEKDVLPKTFNPGRPEFHKSAKPLDFISWFSIGNAVKTYGWFMSERAKAVFEKFNLPERHRFYPFTAYKNDVPYSYFLLATKLDDSKSVDFKRSAFFKGDAWAHGEQLIPVACPSYKACRSGDLSARHIVMDEKFDTTKDIIYLDMMVYWTLMVSKRLIAAIKEHKLTGLELYEEQPVFFSDYDPEVHR